MDKQLEASPRAPLLSAALHMSECHGLLTAPSATHLHSFIIRQEISVLKH